ncbi:putative lactoylglutathione lyase [Herbihabitans rhizosphaerae]|uniref:Putative lactoylglutathione lyase n=1 Tax=Herbihabitans rhizosphaerae TaxID=1872711 RepID=A0A4Q7L512_9PSEU|nr:VOC family protein [Herbihabitans rhizosphaerae]RZS44377.1 putative lactoylglutathione lyase [Herbihabitans rhizosphaerae]
MTTRRKIIWLLVAAAAPLAVTVVVLSDQDDPNPAVSSTPTWSAGFAESRRKLPSGDVSIRRVALRVVGVNAGAGATPGRPKEIPMQTIIGLPVTDVAKSKEFFTALGFTVNPYVDDEKLCNIVLNDGSSLMLYAREVFTSYTGVAVPDPASAREVMNGFAAESREQVDEIAAKALAAGGGSLGDAQENGGLYMRAFTDLDGHWWSVNHIAF